MRLSARVDYALRAAAELAAAGDGPTTVGELAKEQDMPPKYLENILLQMRRAGLVRGQRGPEEATCWPARPPRSAWPM